MFRDSFVRKIREGWPSSGCRMIQVTEAEAHDGIACRCKSIA
ncbi:hypothetical protein RMSM_02438 [Rhodopirellula maiorica SM1]|uniref:Uncharacterized protein n=1 Tax=Rhodopirellula maiorica SM1 TaxID=1265738 RepID=M5RMT1_9BACT|nr:hypothetical protein RMSM_02438 [Rhodopirellula maiorica SM1]